MEMFRFWQRTAPDWQASTFAPHDAAPCAKATACGPLRHQRHDTNRQSAARPVYRHKRKASDQ